MAKPKPAPPVARAREGRPGGTARRSSVDLLGRNPGPSVGHLDEDAFSDGHPHLDRRLGGENRRRVGEQVVQDLADPVRIGVDRALGRASRTTEWPGAVVRAALIDVVDQRHQIDLLDPEGALLVEPGEEEEVVDEAGPSVRPPQRMCRIETSRSAGRWLAPRSKMSSAYPGST